MSYAFKEVKSSGGKECQITHHNSTVDMVKVSLPELLTDLNQEGWEIVHVAMWDTNTAVLLRLEEE